MRSQEVMHAVSTVASPNKTTSLASVKQVIGTCMGAFWRIWLNENHSSFWKLNI